jgi:hypothetical protein
MVGVFIVNRPGIVSLFMNGGDASRWLAGRMRTVKQVAARTAPDGPPRVGDLPHLKIKHAHGLTRTQFRAGPGAVQSLYNRAKHAEVVHEGFAGMIYPHGGYLRIPKSSLFLYRLPEGAWGNKSNFVFPRREPGGMPAGVKGQKANPWMARAARMVFADVAHIPLPIGPTGGNKV